MAINWIITELYFFLYQVMHDKYIKVLWIYVYVFIGRYQLQWLIDELQADRKMLTHWSVNIKTSELIIEMLLTFIFKSITWQHWFLSGLSIPQLMGRLENWKPDVFIVQEKLSNIGHHCSHVHQLVTLNKTYIVINLKTSISI